MYLTSQEINNFDESALIEFLDRKIIEGHHIDYKVALSGKGKTSQHKNFLKDVTSFANASGGDIFIGVKEPEDELTAENQVVGVMDGIEVCRKLERIARDCIQPRITGFRIIPISVKGGRNVIVVHIPPSTNRPHMVYYEKHQYFYIRHQESSNPMTIDEIRETVISSLSAEARAKQYLAEQEKEVRAYDTNADSSTLLIQAIPIFSPETDWDVLSTEFLDMLEGSNRSGRLNDDYNLRVYNRPKPNIFGLEAINEKIHKTQVHRNGYISTSFFIEMEFYKDYGIERANVLFPNQLKSVFEAFCEICTDAAQITGSDLPFVFRCKLLNAKNARLFKGGQIKSRMFSEEYGRNEIVWPDQVSRPGESLSPIADEWLERMYNAFHLPGPPKQ